MKTKLFGVLLLISAFTGPTWEFTPAPITNLQSTDPVQISKLDPILKKIDLDKEDHGYYTSNDLEDNVQAHFNRTEIVLEVCWDTYPPNKRFIGWLEDNITLPDKALCIYELRYVRDDRDPDITPLNHEGAKYYRRESNQINREVVWRLQIPRGFGVLLSLANLELHEGDLAPEDCNADYFSYYADENTPKKVCGNHRSVIDNFEEYPDLSTLTIKFVSDDINNSGNYTLGIYLTPRGCNGQSRQERSVQAGASVEESSVITPEEPGDNEEEVKMQSHIENLEEEDSEAIENEPTPNEIVECFSNIVKYGYKSAYKYRLSSPNEECRKLVLDFIQNGGYITI